MGATTVLIDGMKMKSARDRRALTQEALAYQARVNVRTIQRAENGEPIRHETLADIAAALGVPPAGLLKPEPANDTEPDPDADFDQIQVLKRVEGAEGIIALLERSTMAVLGCTTSPTEENMPVLRQVIEMLEEWIGHPWSEERCLPLHFGSLLPRLQALSRMNALLGDLERIGLSLYSAASTLFVKVPYYSEEGMVTRTNQQPRYVTAARFIIADYDNERVRASGDVIWPLPIEEEEVPF